MKGEFQVSLYLGATGFSLSCESMPETATNRPLLILLFLCILSHLDIAKDME